MAGPFCFLDRDGTIIADQGYQSDPDGVQLLAGAPEGLRRIAGLGYRLVIVTNQSGIGRGFFSAEAAQRTNSRLRELLAGEGVSIAAMMMCPHAPQEHCTCRKPGRGLVDRALALLGGTLVEAVVIGDKPSDMGLAAAIGARAILIAPDPPPDFGQAAAAPDLAAAADLLVLWRAA
jgi:D-glycero-D-manno-heptose 1,7-bisphosphate phosphatase